MTLNRKVVADRIVDVAIREMKLSESVAKDVAFHMTDWFEDLDRFSRFCANPGQLTNEQVNKLLLAFLIHVPNHLAAAAKLYADTPVCDIFGVGAVGVEFDE